MKKITRWSPDTCGCVVEYNWDDAVSEAERVHTLSKVEKKCINHQHLSDQDVYSALFDENPRKNKVLDAIHSQFPALVDQVKWSFDENRVLQIKIPPDFSIAEKGDLQKKIDQEHGSGKVKIG